jgi:hypothetical protein
MTDMTEARPLHKREKMLSQFEVSEYNQFMHFNTHYAENTKFKLGNVLPEMSTQFKNRDATTKRSTPVQR